MLQKQTILSMG